MISPEIKNTLIQDSDFRWEKVDDFCKRKVMAYNDQLMLVKVAFKKDGVGALHHHPHLQISYVTSGSFEVSIGEEKKILNGGDVYFVPSEEVHGVVCLEDGELIDVFNPSKRPWINMNGASTEKIIEITNK